MNPMPDFDLAAAHRFFSAHCFNAAWDLIDKPDRSADEDRAMAALTHASIYHWAQRPDVSPLHLSVGYWQAARVAALLGHADEARRHAETSRAFAEGLAPFYRGYAQEALARAARLAGDTAAAAEHLAHARRHAADVADGGERALLERDLDELAR